MSKAAFWQRGESLDYPNNTTDKIEANTILVFGTRVGVVGMDIAPGEMGSLHVTGVFEFPKREDEITAGAEVYYSETDGVITSEAEGNIKAGFAVSGAASEDGTVLVKINA